MSERSIEEFKAVLKGGGIRPTMYEVVLTLPVRANWYESNYGEYLRDFTFLCKAAQIPSSTLSTMTIGLPAGGALKFPSSRIFEPWNVKVINDNGMNIRALLENWSRALMGRNRQSSSSPLLSQQYGTADVYQLDRKGEVIRGYCLKGLYPTVVVGQDLNYETTDTISEFDVTFDYQYWDIIESVYSPLFTQEVLVA